MTLCSGKYSGAHKKGEDRTASALALSLLPGTSASPAEHRDLLSKWRPHDDHDVSTKLLASCS